MDFYFTILHGDRHTSLPDHASHEPIPLAVIALRPLGNNEGQGLISSQGLALDIKSALSEIKAAMSELGQRRSQPSSGVRLARRKDHVDFNFSDSADGMRVWVV